jgi:nucleotide-binding universal stress UspA family protein
MARPAAGLRTAVIGTDGSAHARRAAAFLARLARHPQGRAIVVSVLDPPLAPSQALMPSAVRQRLSAELAHMERARQRAAQRHIDAASRTLAQAGWRVEPALRIGVPVEELLKVADASRADVIVLGARGTSGLARLLLGSVADGILKRAPAPVLLVPYSGSALLSSRRACGACCRNHQAAFDTKQVPRRVDGPTPAARLRERVVVLLQAIMPTGGLQKVTARPARGIIASATTPPRR